MKENALIEMRIEEIKMLEDAERQRTQRGNLAAAKLLHGEDGHIEFSTEEAGDGAVVVHQGIKTHYISLNDYRTRADVVLVLMSRYDTSIEFINEKLGWGYWAWREGAKPFATTGDRWSYKRALIEACLAMDKENKNV